MNDVSSANQIWISSPQKMASDASYPAFIDLFIIFKYIYFYSDEKWFYFTEWLHFEGFKKKVTCIGFIIQRAFMCECLRINVATYNNLVFRKMSLKFSHICLWLTWIFTKKKCKKWWYQFFFSIGWFSIQIGPKKSTFQDGCFVDYYLIDYFK